jgi:putative transposase
MLKIFSRHEFESLAREHHSGRKFRKFDRWSQFVAMTSAQLSGRASLRDLVSNLSAQSSKLYHLGLKPTNRSTLARINNEKPHTLYEALFGKLLGRCKSVSPRHRFRFNNKLYSLDASIIDLCLSVFPWATFRKAKGAVKLHIGLDHDGYLPAFVSLKEGRGHEMSWARTLELPRASIVVFDKAFVDYKWFASLVNKGVFFVTRQKTNACYKVTERREANKARGILCDQTIKLTGLKGRECPFPLRRIRYKDAETGRVYVFVTNSFHLSARTVADIYKERWQIENFFKWIKQNLKIKTFLGTSRNAVLTQIWIALCAYLMLAWLKFKHHLGYSLQQMLRLLQLNLFERRDLMALLRGEIPKTTSLEHNQLSLGIS